MIDSLPIFENEQYMTDLNKLLSSKELKESYDYKNND